jgi:hypothetical protein
MLRINKNNWTYASGNKSQTFGFPRGNCSEPDWLVEDDFEGNHIKVYEEYEIEYDGDMVESSYLYVDELKLDYEGWYGKRSCYPDNHSGMKSQYEFWTGTCS